MQRFYCQCGSQVFFDSSRCVNCDARLGFDPIAMTMRSLLDIGGGIYRAADGLDFRFCENGRQYDVCNWLKPAYDGQALCRACQFNRTVPNQSLQGNQVRWRRLEEGKKRLFYTLLQLGLPLVDGWQDPDNGLLLDFIEDERSQPLVFAETFVSTGYLGGIITINTLEADDVARTAVRHELNETYRTVLGHLRHESGHYYWARLAPGDERRAEFRRLFGDEGRDYQQALQSYYANGPAADWRAHYISPYASAHPAEDWAESWGHYLHIYDAMETAASHGVIPAGPAEMDITSLIGSWRTLSITLNELNRSVGRGDAYPFVINTEVQDKLEFVASVIRRLRTLH